MIPSNRLVSVIIPTYDAAAYLRETIESVLQQDWEAMEVIVCDDASTDGTVAIAREFAPRVTVMQVAHRGLPATRNRAMRAARGAFLLHLDADDLLVPGAIRTLMARHDDDQDYDIVVGRLESFVSPDLPADVATRFHVPAEPQRGHLSGSAIVRASAFDRLGGFDESYPVAADLEWYVRATGLGARVCSLDEVVLRRRIHGGNKSLRDKSGLQGNAFQIVRAALARNRSPT